MADIDALAEIPDPVERAREVGRRMAQIPAVHQRLKEIRRAAVLEMRNRGMSYADIGAELGLHRNRVQQIADGRSGGGQGGRRPEVD